MNQTIQKPSIGLECGSNASGAFVIFIVTTHTHLSFDIARIFLWLLFVFYGFATQPWRAEKIRSGGHSPPLHHYKGQSLDPESPRDGGANAPETIAKPFEPCPGISRDPQRAGVENPL